MWEHTQSHRKITSCDLCTSEPRAASQTSAQPGLQFIYDYRLHNTHSTCWVNVSHLIITDNRACASRWVPRLILIILSSQDPCVLKKRATNPLMSDLTGHFSTDSAREERQMVIINVCPSSRSSAVIQEVKWAWFRMSSPAGVTLE